MKGILKPLSKLYGYITSIRNKNYDSGKSRVVSFTIPIISVGNLSVGGTGKTPFVEFLINRYKTNYKIGVLSRGYGRKTKGVIYADESASAKTIGDEPMQYHSKYSDIEVVVAEQRVLGMPSFEKANLVILDDAFQHRAIDRDVNIMLSDYNKPFFKDHVLPLGRLREKRKGACRADIIIFTKVKNELNAEIINDYILNSKVYAPEAKIYFTSIEYGQAYDLQSNQELSIKNLEVFMMTSIANANPFVEHIQENLNCSIKKHYQFRDHYSFTEKTVARIENEIGKNKIVIISEKDAVKLKPLCIDSSLKFVVIPIQPKVLNNQEEDLLSDIDLIIGKSE